MNSKNEDMRNRPSEEPVRYSYKFAMSGKVRASWQFVSFEVNNNGNASTLFRVDHLGLPVH